MFYAGDMDGRRQRIYAARRAGLVERLVSHDRLPREGVERLLAEWEADAGTRAPDPASRDVWVEATKWVYDRLGRRRRPER